MQNHKKLSARILSLALSATMVFTSFPATVFAAEGDIPLGVSNIECHATHDEDCGYKEAVEGTDCSHKNEDGTYSCASNTVSDNTATPGDADKSACTHEDDCGYVEAVKGADCKHTCEKCDVKDSGTAEKSTYDKVVELFTALPKASVITGETTEEEKDAFFAQLTVAMEAFDALTADEQDLFLKEQLELYKAAMALNDAVTGSAPATMTDKEVPPFGGTNWRTKAGETAKASEIVVGDRIEIGAYIENNTSKDIEIAYDSYEMFLYDGLDVTKGPYAADYISKGDAAIEVLSSYTNTNSTWPPAGVVADLTDVSTRKEWVVYSYHDHNSSVKNLWLTSPDRTPKFKYTATKATTGLLGATAAFEIILAETTTPCPNNTFEVMDYDKVKITITPTGSNVFKAAPTVSSTNTTTVGTPVEQADGSYVCEIQTFTGNPTITVEGAATLPSAPPAITTASLPDATLDVAYSQTLAATGSTPITWSVTTGSLPAGLTLDGSTGVISGTPTTGGTATFTVKATNGNAPDATKELSITVNEKPVITTTTLPNAKLGTAYSETLAATGTAPITWTLSSGSSLPAGLTLSAAGVISGTPTTEGTTNFTVEATNITGTKALAFW